MLSNSALSGIMEFRPNAEIHVPGATPRDWAKRHPSRFLHTSSSPPHHLPASEYGWPTLFSDILRFCSRLLKAMDKSEVQTKFHRLLSAVRHPRLKRWVNYCFIFCTFLFLFSMHVVGRKVMGGWILFRFLLEIIRDQDQRTRTEWLSERNTVDSI